MRRSHKDLNLAYGRLGQRLGLTLGLRRLDTQTPYYKPAYPLAGDTGAYDYWQTSIWAPGLTLAEADAYLAGALAVLDEDRYPTRDAAREPGRAALEPGFDLAEPDDIERGRIVWYGPGQYRVAAVRGSDIGAPLAMLEPMHSNGADPVAYPVSWQLLRVRNG